MKAFYSFFSLFFISGICSAQYLAKNNTAAGPLLVREAVPSASQQWEKEEDQVNGRISNSKLLKMKNTAEAIVAFFQESCISEGNYSPVWHGEYFSEKTSPGPQMKFGVQCNFNDQGAHLTVMANDLSPLLGHLVLNDKTVLTIRTAIAAKNDCPYFEIKAPRSKIWLVTAHNDLLPYIPVTRKEYLKEAQSELQATRTRFTEELKKKAPIRPLAIQEAEKKAAIDRLNSQYSGIALQIRMRAFLKDYKTDEEYLKQNIEIGTAELDSTLHFMDSLLKYSGTEELTRPAIVSVQAADFRGFEDGISDNMLIRINSAYFKSAVGGETPQFFLVCWQYENPDPAAIDIDRQIEQKFDGQKLKGMLGK
jgi:hypothetical protein